MVRVPGLRRRHADTPKDQTCFGVEHKTPLSYLPKVEWSDGDFRPETFDVYARHNPHLDQAAKVEMSLGGATGTQLTPLEARRLALALMSAAEEVEPLP